MKLTIIIGSIVIALLGVPAGAQQSELRQEIKPYECTYTTVENGSGTTTDSTCENQPIPTLISVTVNEGRPVLRGIYNSSRAIMLRVWIGGQWYTNGFDSRLSTDGDAWMLDLTNLANPLLPGIYNVAVEVETSEGLLLRNVDAGSFIVSNKNTSMPTLPIFSGPGSSKNPFFFPPTILPPTQEPTSAPIVHEFPYGFTPLHLEVQDHIDEVVDAIPATIKVVAYGTGATVVGAGAVWGVRRWLHR